MMNEDRPYAGILMNDGTEISHYGVKGMKWGKHAIGKVKGVFGKVKGVFDKENPIKKQMNSAMQPKKEDTPAVKKVEHPDGSTTYQKVTPPKKKTDGKKTNTVRSGSKGPNLTNNTQNKKSVIGTASKAVSNAQKVEAEKRKKQQEAQNKWWSIGRHN